MSKKFQRFDVVILTTIVLFVTAFAQDDQSCRPIYVRLPRAALDQSSRISGPYDQKQCQNACSLNQHPANPRHSYPCAAYNHRRGHNAFSHDCQMYTEDQLRDLDHDLVARDQYSFYRKYCVKAKKVCKSTYEFDLAVDSYMDRDEIESTERVNSLEECLSHCLDESQFTCRSVSFNRTGGICLLSQHNRISRPGSVRVNGVPDYRIDYYENNCYNDSFSFVTKCKDEGILITVDSQFPYTGAIYGLYDYFTCRYEPSKEKQFLLFFPYPNVSKNCSDSMYYQDGDVVVDVIVSSDGVEPLYFTTDQDVLFHGRCKAPSGDVLAKSSSDKELKKPKPPQDLLDQDKDDPRRGAQLQSTTSSYLILQTTSLHNKKSHKTSTDPSSTTTEFVPETLRKKHPTLLPAIDSTPEQKQATESKWLDQHTPSITSQKVYASVEFGGQHSSTSPNQSGPPYKSVLIGNIFTDFNDAKTTSARYPVETEQRRTDWNSENFNRVSTTATTFDILSTTTPHFWWKTDAVSESTSISSTNAFTTSNEEIPWWRRDRFGIAAPTFPSFTTTPTPASTPAPSVSTNASTSTAVTFASDALLTKDVTLSTTSASTDTITTTLLPSSSETTTSTAPSSATSSLTLNTTTVAITETTTITAADQISSTATAVLINETTTTPVPQDIKFELLYNGVATQAVLIQSLITLSFVPGSSLQSITPSQMALLGCKIEAVGSRYFLDPLVLVENGCPSDGVGLVYPVRRSRTGLAMEMEAFRFTDTSEVLYKCNVRVCDNQCSTFPCFDGNGNPYVSFGRRKRQQPPSAGSYKDYSVERKLVVFNNQYDFQYYLRTGRVPQNQYSEELRFGR